MDELMNFYSVKVLDVAVAYHCAYQLCFLVNGLHPTCLNFLVTVT